MKIIDASFENWYTIDFKLNWIAIIIVVAAVVFVSFLWSKVRKYINRKSVQVDEVKLGIGSNTVTLKYNQKGREIAYKLWVEMCTRKIGLEFDKENDVISEIYDSWYSFFTMARNLLKEIPPEQLETSRQLIELTEKVLNDGLRPHLTKWQARYRKWYEVNCMDEKAPQDIQITYPQYGELIEDLISTNVKMMEYKRLMQEIAFKE